MKYSELLAVLKDNPERELTFEFEHGLIRKDYHITEVLNIQVEAVDCGGAVDKWTERVLQLIEPKKVDGERFMQVKKAMTILNKSAEKIDLSKDGKVILEYRPQDSSAAQRFNVSGVNLAEGRVVVQTEGAKTQCKAIARTTEDKDKSSCCGSEKAAIQKSSCCG